MRFSISDTRSTNYVPRIVLFFIVIGLLLQSAWHFSFVQFTAQRYALPEPPPQEEFFHYIALGDEITLAKLIMLWLQAFDNQPGISLPLKELDYVRVIKWLDLILKLDNRTGYPLFVAARFYAEVPVVEKQHLMIDFIKAKFLDVPDKRWPAMVHAVYIAKHRIKDMQLAIECARLLRLHTQDEDVPHWVKQMEFFVLEDSGEFEAAKILIGGLLESGELDDPQQKRFLMQRLHEIEQRQRSQQ